MVAYVVFRNTFERWQLVNFSRLFELFPARGLQIETRIFPGGTDSRFLREMGIPALGFSPIINHPVLLHDTDEYLAESMFLRGIEIYMKLISSLGDIANDEN